MSAVLNVNPGRPSFSVLEGLRQAPARRANPRLFIAATIVIGALAIGLSNLMLNIATSQGVYELAHLKNEKKELALNTQIIGTQVASLSSDQNLADAAHALGMVSNANPVFIDVAAQKVYGKPLAAVNSTAARISGNLIKNSLLTTKTTAASLQAAAAAEKASATAKVSATDVATGSFTAASSTKLSQVPSNSGWTTASSGYVGGAKSSNAQVGLAGSGIPAAPTH
jgi:hypothetical protein